MNQSAKVGRDARDAKPEIPQCQVTSHSQSENYVRMTNADSHSELSDNAVSYDWGRWIRLESRCFRYWLLTASRLVRSLEPRVFSGELSPHCFHRLSPLCPSPLWVANPSPLGRAPRSFHFTLRLFRHPPPPPLLLSFVYLPFLYTFSPYSFASTSHL